MKSIVLVDDEAIVCETVKLTLGSRGYRVEAVDDATKAFETIRRARPDLVILDLYMPELDGLALCRQLKADAGLQRIPVLFLSGSSTPIDVMSSLEAGAYDYVAKPVDGEDLLAKVESILKVRS